MSQSWFGKLEPQWKDFKGFATDLTSCVRQAAEKLARRHHRKGHAFQPGDANGVSRGRLRWQVMIRRAHQHMVKEGWLENHAGKVWK